MRKGNNNMTTKYYIIIIIIIKICHILSKAIPVTGRERSRLPHLLNNRLTDGGKVVSRTRRPRFTPQESSWYSFLLEAVSTPGP
jgi:hypothetical protein